MRACAWSRRRQRCTDMDITGTYTLNAPPEKVWALMMDPVAIASCIPGCERLEPAGVDCYTAAITIGMAAITGKDQGTVTISEKTPPRVILPIDVWKARAGQDSCKGTWSTITLREVASDSGGANTIVDVNGTAQTGGTIARLGQRLIGQRGEDDAGLFLRLHAVEA